MVNRLSCCRQSRRNSALAAAALASYMATMIGAAFGGIAMGSLADRFGIMKPLILSAVFLLIGFTAAAWTGSYWQFFATQAVLIGMLGSSTTFGPLVADASLWFVKKRGLAVGIVASGNYLSGAVWPPILQHTRRLIRLAQHLYRHRHLLFRHHVAARAHAARTRPYRSLGDVLSGSQSPACRARRRPISSGSFFWPGSPAVSRCRCRRFTLSAYCGDLGYGTARGAEMLSIILGMGVVSRLDLGLYCGSQRRGGDIDPWFNACNAWL